MSHKPPRQTDPGQRCPFCGHEESMSLVRTLPGLGSMPELHSFQCKHCGQVETKEVK
jgi:transcription elongation factor Elf1